MGGPGSGGHNRKTLEQKILEGNPGKRPLQKTEDISSGELPLCPDWLSPEAKLEWARICEVLPNLTQKDRGALEGLCSAYDRWFRAEKKLRKSLTQNARHGRAPRPEVKIAHDSLNQYKAFLIELGLTPKSRIGQTPSKPKTPKDPLDAALGTRRMN